MSIAYGLLSGEFLNKVSIDEITTSHLEQAVKQLDFAPKEIYVKTFDVNTQYKRINGFSYRLMESTKTAVL